MKNLEASRENPHAFIELASDTLFRIYEKIRSMGAFTPEALNHDVTDRIRGSLRDLEERASSRGDRAKAEVFAKLSSAFYTLHTVGVIDRERSVFVEKAAHAFELLEMVLLSIDGQSPKHKGKITSLIEAERVRY